MRRLFASVVLIAGLGAALPASPVGADAKAINKTVDGVTVRTWFRCNTSGDSIVSVTWWTQVINGDDAAHDIETYIGKLIPDGSEIVDDYNLLPGASHTTTKTDPYPSPMLHTGVSVDGTGIAGTTYIFDDAHGVCSFAGALDATPVDWGDQNPVVGADSLLLAGIAAALVAAGAGLLGLRRARPA